METVGKSLPTDGEYLCWYGGGERSPLYNRLRVNAGYAIFAINSYKFTRNDC